MFRYGNPTFLLLYLIEAEWRIYALVNLPSLVQIMACRLAGAKPLSEPLLEYFLIWTLGKQTSVKHWAKFHSRKCIWKCRLRNSVHFVSASMCYRNPRTKNTIPWYFDPAESRGTGSTLAHAITCCLVAPSHCLEEYGAYGIHLQ